MFVCLFCLEFFVLICLCNFVVASNELYYSSNLLICSVLLLLLFYHIQVSMPFSHYFRAIYHVFMPDFLFPNQSCIYARFPVFSLVFSRCRSAVSSFCAESSRLPLRLLSEFVPKISEPFASLLVGDVYVPD